MSSPDKRVLLAGIEPALAKELHLYLASRGVEVTESPETDSTPLNFDLVFCETHSPGLRKLLQNVSSPVVVVSRVPEVDDWLDAIDAGATDYCAAPFEAEQLDWILESTIGLRRKKLAAATA
jgi:DNA-binding response OmpR family regulator